MPTAKWSPKLVARFGSRPVNVAGLLLVGVGLVVLAQVGTDTPYWLLVVGLVPLGAGMGAAMTPATTAITAALPGSQQGVGSALNDLSREVGGAFGIAVLGSVLAAIYSSNLQLPSTVPASAADSAHSSFGVAVGMGGSIKSSASSAFVDGLHVAFLFGAGAAVIAAFGVMVLLRARRPADATSDETIERRPVAIASTSQ
jgi:MFS family permease